MIHIYQTKTEKKKEHEAGLILLSDGLSDLYDLHFIPEELDTVLKKGRHGKPYLPDHNDIHFNISNSNGTVVCAFADAPIGIDIEYIRELKANISKRILSPHESALLAKEEMYSAAYYELLFRYWTLKEAWLKMDGSGFSQDAKRITFYPESAGSAAVTSGSVQSGDIPQEQDSFACIPSSDPAVRCLQGRLGETGFLSVCCRNLKEDAQTISVTRLDQ